VVAEGDCIEVTERQGFFSTCRLNLSDFVGLLDDRFLRDPRAFFVCFAVSFRVFRGKENTPVSVNP
jgi:hypothetical protein